MPAKDDECECTNWKDIGQIIVLVIGAVFAGIAALKGDQNQDKLNEVKHGQNAQIERSEKADTGRENLEKQTDAIDKRTKVIEKAATAFEDSLGPTLWSAWKYAESISDFDPTPQNVAKTKEAKAAYDAYLRKK